MSTSQDQVFASALSLSQPERADLAYQLLQSLTLPGDEITQEEFAAQLQQRIAADRRGELKSFDLEQTRATIQQRLAQGRAS